MFKIAVCEDISVERIDIINKIRSVFEKKKVEFDIDGFSNGEKLIANKGYFDIIFMDIKMDKLSGIDAAKEIRKNSAETKIIFITAFKEYVFEAFDVEAFNYLLKPVSEEEINTIINKILKNVARKSDKKSFLVVKKGVEVVKILFSKICFFEVQNRIVSIHTQDSVIEYYDKISNIEKCMPEDGFFRCHRSYIVNLKYVKRFNRNEILLDNDETILLAKNRYNEFSQSFLRYLKKDMV